MDAALVSSPGQIEADIQVEGSDYVSGRDLETAIRLSLFLDARASVADELPSGAEGFGADRRGWWASGFIGDGSEFGSRLWLLARSKLTQEVRQRFADFARQALEWLVTDQIARSVEVSTQVLGIDSIQLDIAVTREDGIPARFAFVWEL